MARHEGADPPAMVWTGREHAVVWIDGSDGTFRVRLARLDAGLNRVGPTAEGPVAAPGGPAPSMIVTGSGFWVAWLDGTQDQTAIQTAIRVTSFGADGRWTRMVTDVETHPVEKRDGRIVRAQPMSAPSLAWNGEYVAVAWVDRSEPARVRFLALDPAGAPVGPESSFPVVVRSAEPRLGSPALVWNGTEFGLAWVEYHEGTRTIREREFWVREEPEWDRVMFVRLDAAGTPIAEPQLVARDRVSSAERALALTTTGSAFLAVWANWPTGACDRPPCVRAARIDRDGVRITPEEPRDPYRTEPPDGLFSCRGGRWQQHPGWMPALSVAWRGDELGVAWTGPDPWAPFWLGAINADDLGVRRPTAALPVRASGFADAPSLTWNGTGWGLAWIDRTTAGERVRLASVDATGARLEARAPLAGSAPAPDRIGLAATGDGYGIAWPDARDGAPRLYFARLDRTGRIAAGPIPVEGSSTGATPSLAWNGRGFGAAWVDDWPPEGATPTSPSVLDSDAILFAALDVDGRVVSEPVVVARRGGFSPRLVWAGNQYGIVWKESWCPAPSRVSRPGRPPGIGYDVPVVSRGDPCTRFARLDATGSRIGDEVAFAERPDGASTPVEREQVSLPALAWNGAEFGVAWNEEWHEAWNYGDRTVLYRLLPDGTTASTAFLDDTHEPPNLVPEPTGFTLATFRPRGHGPVDRHCPWVLSRLVRDDVRIDTSLCVNGLDEKTGVIHLYDGVASADLAWAPEGYLVALSNQSWEDLERPSGDGPPDGRAVELATFGMGGQRSGPDVRWPVRRPGAGNVTLAVDGTTVGVLWTRDIGTATVLEFAAATCD